jgi:hypothetical protein
MRRRTRTATTAALVHVGLTYRAKTLISIDAQVTPIAILSAIIQPNSTLPTVQDWHMTVIGYTRVSTTDQNLDVQENEGRSGANSSRVHHDQD